MAKKKPPTKRTDRAKHIKYAAPLNFEERSDPLMRAFADEPSYARQVMMVQICKMLLELETEMLGIVLASLAKSVCDGRCIVPPYPGA